MLTHIDTIIFDLNGTLYEKGVAINGSNETIRKLREHNYHLSFITNTDGRSIKDVYQRVLKKGLDVKEEEIYTPVSAVKVFIEQNNDKLFYPLVTDDVFESLVGVNRNVNNPDYVVIGDFCDKVSFEEINKVFRMIKNGAKIIALSKTLWYIDVDGYSINTGAFVKMFEIACESEAILMGKPSKDFFYMGLKRTNSQPENTLVIGDDIKTDILGAKNIGATAALVKTGVYHEDTLKSSLVQPDFVIDNINDLPNLLGL
ncbi:TIGR01458 family HAD-type hydrolase [Vallitalea okinawensis]|uniref:TIGR01458 family HAD-type hydrolase n=1 Tax=Vallitalea okinawensis TaxID=2078660 RepID=UPI000CFB9F57|nr:TIGR01458 family HAD-type hydrolase [Vallitalea okinawensis]